MVFSSSSRSARALKLTPMQFDSTPSMPSLSLSRPSFSAALSASTCSLTRRGVAAQRSARNWRNPKRVSPRTANDTVVSSSPVPTVGRRMRPSADWMSR
ncbi:hypothetical protein G6F22_021174 [Rhizopus arrhizus]|nr:hypothetical protein G6F22_021174 [Rhizopus arrhizus]KAG1384988.1 hypothetical protein G6F59_017678 [Rhizopus arrhizus]